jgi:hypothetical protein
VESAVGNSNPNAAFVNQNRTLCSGGGLLSRAACNANAVAGAMEE